MNKITVGETHIVYVGTHIRIRGDLNPGGGAVNPLPQPIELGSFRSIMFPQANAALLDVLMSHLTRIPLFDVEQENRLFPLGVDLFISL